MLPIAENTHVFEEFYDDADPDNKADKRKVVDRNPIPWFLNEFDCSVNA